MGLFDYIRSSYNLGEPFTETICQTKTIEEGYSGTMTDYWIDPAGRLWYSLYKDTHDFVYINEDDPDYDPNKKFMNCKWVPTGKKGKFIAHKITKHVEIYPETWEGDWKDWPTLSIYFVDGIIKDFKKIQ
jgi:hypothetical protein